MMSSSALWTEFLIKCPGICISPVKGNVTESRK
jgi:hypothetical protein